MPDDWIGRKEMASMLGVSERTLTRRLEKTGLNTSEFYLNRSGQRAMVSPQVLVLWNEQESPVADVQLQREVEMYAAEVEGLRSEAKDQRIAALEKDLSAAHLEIDRLRGEVAQLSGAGAKLADALNGFFQSK